MCNLHNLPIKCCFARRIRVRQLTCQHLATFSPDFNVRSNKNIRAKILLTPSYTLSRDSIISYTATIKMAKTHSQIIVDLSYSLTYQNNQTNVKYKTNNLNQNKTKITKKRILVRRDTSRNVV